MFTSPQLCFYRKFIENHDFCPATTDAKRQRALLRPTVVNERIAGSSEHTYMGNCLLTVVGG